MFISERLPADMMIMMVMNLTLPDHKPASKLCITATLRGLIFSSILTITTIHKTIPMH